MNYNVDQKLLDAAQNGDLAAVREMIDQGADANASETYGLYTGLIIASAGGYLDVVRALLACGADINAKNYSGLTSLIWASQNGHVDIVRLLLDKGADVNAKDNGGATSLIAVSSHVLDYPDVAEALIRAGADVNAKDDKGETALMKASVKRLSGVMRSLLDNGADVNAKDNEGRTALMHLCSESCEYTYTARMLLNAGADISAQDNSGETSFMKASAQKHTRIMAMINVVNGRAISLREKILMHALGGGKTSVKVFGPDKRKFNVFNKFWREYTAYVKNEDVFHLVGAFCHTNGNDYILIEVFDDEADALLNRYSDTGVLRKIEKKVLSAAEIALKRTGCRAFGNYALPGCILTSTDEWSYYISMIQEDKYRLLEPQAFFKFFDLRALFAKVTSQ